MLPIVQYKVNGNQHPELVIDVGLSDVHTENDCSVRSRLERRVKLVGWDLRPIDILIEEPVQLAVAFDVHFRSHALFDCPLAILGGGGMAAISVHKVAHGLFELLVAGYLVISSCESYEAGMRPWGKSGAA